MSNSREVVFPSFCSVDPVVVRAPDFAGLVRCRAFCSLKDVTRNLLKETIRNPVDLGIPPELGWWCGISSW